MCRATTPNCAVPLQGAANRKVVKVQGDPNKPLVNFCVQIEEELAQVAHNLAAMTPAELLDIARDGGVNVGDRVGHTSGVASTGRLGE